MIRKLLYGVALALSAAAPALADNWPCEVALCMSDPRARGLSPLAVPPLTAPCVSGHVAEACPPAARRQETLPCGEQSSTGTTARPALG